MAQKKKLQVFISSTYTDLKEERQAAVEAILTAGHIPAGMELFAAGDESQMNVIKKWIDESDVYMLILGGRYGSIEPKSQKSYIQLEYEYALEKGKPLFAVVITEEYLEEKVRRNGSLVIEKENFGKLKAFRESVCNKVVRFWSDAKDIKLATLEKLSELSKRPDLVGWIPGNEIANSDTGAEEIARLTNENFRLREEISKLTINSVIYNGLTFEEMSTLLATNLNDIFISENKFLSEGLKKVASLCKDSNIQLLHLFLAVRFFDSSVIFKAPKSMYKEFQRLEEYGLITFLKDYTIAVTQTGNYFLLRWRIKNNIEEVNEFLVPFSLALRETMYNKK